MSTASKTAGASAGTRTAPGGIDYLAEELLDQRRVLAHLPHALLRMLALSAVFMPMTFLIFAIYGGFAAAVRTHLIARPRVIRRVRRVFAASFVALSVTLATPDR